MTGYFSCGFLRGGDRESRRPLLWLPILCTAFAGTAPVLAQTGDAPAIERRLILPPGPPAFEVPPEERILTGKDDLVILRKRKFFTLSADVTPRLTSNAFLSDNRRERDLAVTARAGLKAETVIAQRYTVNADLGYTIARYNRFSQLDYDSVSASIGGRVPVDLWTFSLGYQIANTKDRGFDRHLVTQNSVSGSVSYRVAIDRETALFPFLSASRIWGNPGDFSNASLVPGVQFLHQFAGDLLFIADAHIVARQYDDFFESATGKTRGEIGGGSNVSLRWTPREDIIVQGKIGFGYLQSTIDSVDYLEFNVTPTITAQLRF